MLKLEVISEYAALSELRNSWWSVGALLNSWTPFQTPEWLLTWWRHFGSGELHCLVLSEDNSQLAGVVPLFLHEWNGRRQLTLIGSGISDYLDPAILPAWREEAGKLLCAHLENEKRWDCCNLQDLSPESILLEVSSCRGTRASTEPDQPCSEIDLSGSFDDYWSVRPRGLRRNVRRYGEKASNIAPPEFSFCDHLNYELLEELIRLHTSRWQRQGEAGMVVLNSSAQFLRDVAQQFSRLGMCAFFSMRLEGRVVAVILSFPYRGTLFSYLSGFDAEYEELGLGRLLLEFALKFSFKKKFQVWNFLRGEESYKSDWGAKLLPKVRVILERTSPQA